MNIFRRKTNFIDPNKFQPGPQHDYYFSPETMQMIDEIRMTFQDVYPISIEEWVDGFDRDVNPEKEIAIWLHMAKLYRKTLERLKKADLATKKYILGMLLSTNCGTDRSFLTKTSLLSKSEIDEIFELWIA